MVEYQLGLESAPYAGKRAMDLIGSFLGLILTLLVWPLIAIGIILSSPGTILFRQRRIGQLGRPFTMYKFRTMAPNAEEQLEKLLDIENLDEPVYKIVDDPRVTGFGRWLRRWSLDELPQFWNVLKGDMSLVGPRPEELRIAERYDSWHKRRFALKPGMTGPMQVNGRGDLPLDVRIQLEIDYLNNCSLKTDVGILFRTIPAVISGRGAR